MQCSPYSQVTQQTATAAEQDRFAGVKLAGLDSTAQSFVLDNWLNKRAAAAAQDSGLEGTAPRCVLGKWLAKHAGLLRTLRLEGAAMDEPSIAAGLAAAAATATTAAQGGTASGSASSLTATSTRGSIRFSCLS